MNKIWVDVTVIMGWKGTFTGIQRVVYSYIKRFESDAVVELGLFVFTNGTFREVPYGTFMETLKRNSTMQKPSSSDMSLLQKIRAKGIPVLKRELRDTKYIGGALSSVYKSARVTYRMVLAPRTFSSKISMKGGGGPFNKEDTVFLIDGNWGDEGLFAAAIIKERGKVGFRLAHLVNDIAAIKNPAYVARGATEVITSYFRTILPGIDVLISISQSTQNDVLWFCKDEGIDLTDNRHIVRLGDELEDPLGVQSGSKRMPSVMHGLSKKKFILTVGTVEVRKNHHLLYYVYKLAHEQGIVMPHLVIAGRKGWMAGETYELFKKDSDISEQVTILNPDDAELHWLYENCLFTVFPSFYEGWGIPIAESLSRGKPCISSNTSSMPEVGNGLTIYISPYDPELWLKEISSLDSESLAELEAKIEQNYKTISWDDTYQEFVEACA